VPPPYLLSPHLWYGGWQALFGASQMHGFPAVPGCGMEVVFVRCRRLLKYIIEEMYVAVPLPLPPQPVRAAGGSQPCGLV